MLSVVASYEMPVMEETAIDSLNIIVLMLIYLSDERPASCTLLLPQRGGIVLPVLSQLLL